MAKLRGAMHSDEAAGKFAGSMIFRRGKQGAVVTGYYKPGSVRSFELSEAQIAQRTKYGEAVAGWRALTIEEKAVFNENAKAQNISGWNLYFKNYGGTPPPPPPSYPEFTYNGHTYQINPTVISGKTWGPTATTTGIQSTTDGAGNTTALANLGSTYEAATAVKALSDGGYTDWFLPAKNELIAALTEYKTQFPTDPTWGGFADVTVYWSSTEYSDSPDGSAWVAVYYSFDDYVLSDYGVKDNTNFQIRGFRIKN